MQIIEFYQSIAIFAHWAFAAVGVLLFAVLLLNLAINIRAKQNKEIKKSIAALKKGTKKIGTKAFFVPQEYRSCWQSYQNSCDRLPSQCIKFVERKQKKYLLIVSAIAVLLVLPFAVSAAMGWAFDYLFFCPIILSVLYLLVVFAVLSKEFKRRLKSQNLFQQYVMLLDLYFGKSFFFKQASEKQQNMTNKFISTSRETNQEETLRETAESDYLFKNVLHPEPDESNDNKKTTAPPVLPHAALPTAPQPPSLQNLPSSKFAPCADQKEETKKMYRIRFLVNNGIKADTADRIAAVLAETSSPRTVATQKELNKVLNETLQYISKKRLSA